MQVHLYIKTSIISPLPISKSIILSVNYKNVLKIPLENQILYISILTMYICWTFTHPRIVEWWPVLALTPVETVHTVTVHLCAVLPLVSLRTATVVISLIVYTCCPISTGGLFCTLIIILPTVRA